MGDEPTPVLEVRTEEEGEAVCEQLRAAGIKCNWASVPAETSETGWLESLGNPTMSLQVFVAESDVERAHEVLADRTQA
jgi:hypothetical protein